MARIHDHISTATQVAFRSGWSPWSPGRRRHTGRSLRAATYEAITSFLMSVPADPRPSSGFQSDLRQRLIEAARNCPEPSAETAVPAPTSDDRQAASKRRSPHRP